MLSPPRGSTGCGRTASTNMAHLDLVKLTLRDLQQAAGH